VGGGGGEILERVFGRLELSWVRGGEGGGVWTVGDMEVVIGGAV